MANRYWVGGSANWDATAGTKWATTSGGAGGSAVPTAADDVFFDASSGSGTTTIPASTNVSARSVNFTGYTGTFAFAATSSNLLIGDGTAGASNVALKLSSGMTLTLTANGTITLQSTSTTQQSVTSAGKTMPNLTINGAASSYLLADAMTLAAAFTLTAGTLDTGNFNVQSTSFSTTGSGNKTLSPGSSTWTLTSTNTSMTNAGTNFTLSANTSTFKSNATANAPNWGSTTWNNIVMDGSGNVLATGSSGLNCVNFTRTGTAAKTDALVLSGNITCSGTFTCNGNSTINRVWVRSSTTGTQRTITAATVTVTNSDFSDISGAGAGSWNLSAATGGTGDGLGNSGITFTTPVNRYAVAAGNWSATSTWSATSGGSSGASVPLCHDNVFLDANTPAGTVTNDMPRAAANLDCTGFTRTLQVSSAGTNWFGNFTLVSGMTVSQNNTNTFKGRGSHTITFAGKSLNSSDFDGFGGTYTQQDAASYTGTGAWSLSSGTYVTNNFSLSCLTATISGTNTRALTLGTSTISITTTATSNAWNATTTTGLTFSGASSTISLTVTTANTRTFQGGGLTYGTLNYTVAGSTGILAMGGSNYFDTINFSDVTNARTLQLANATLTTVKTFNVNGTSGKLMSVVSNSAGNPAFVELVGTPPSLDYLSIQDIYSTIPYKFYAGANSTSVSGNTNIILTAAVSGPYIVKQAEITGTATTLTATFPFGMSASANNLLVAFQNTDNDPGTTTTPTGYTANPDNPSSGTARVHGFYKVASGGETNVVLAWTNSRTAAGKLYEVAGFTGTPTLDVRDKNNTAGATSLSTGAGVTNTAQPAIGIASWAAVSSMGATVSFSNSWQEQREVAQLTSNRMAAALLTTTGSVSTTNTWTTSRAAASMMMVFKDVVTATNTGNFFAFF